MTISRTVQGFRHLTSQQTFPDPFRTFEKIGIWNLLVGEVRQPRHRLRKVLVCRNPRISIANRLACGFEDTKFVPQTGTGSGWLSVRISHSYAPKLSSTGGLVLHNLAFCFGVPTTQHRQGVRERPPHRIRRNPRPERRHYTNRLPIVFHDMQLPLRPGKRRHPGGYVYWVCSACCPSAR